MNNCCYRRRKYCRRLEDGVAPWCNAQLTRRSNTKTVIKTNNSSVDQDKMLGQTMSPVVHRPGVLLSRRYSLKTWNVNESWNNKVECLTINGEAHRLQACPVVISSLVPIARLHLFHETAIFVEHRLIQNVWRKCHFIWARVRAVKFPPAYSIWQI